MDSEEHRLNTPLRVEPAYGREWSQWKIFDADGDFLLCSYAEDENDIKALVVCANACDGAPPDAEVVAAKEKVFEAAVRAWRTGSFASRGAKGARNALRDAIEEMVDTGMSGVFPL